MRPFSATAIAAIVGVFAVAAPILISVELAQREGLANESVLTRSYANDVLRRTDEMAGQMGHGIAQIRNANLPPCSPAEIDLMRRIDISSTYIRALGRIEGNQIVCTSLGTKQPIDVGPPDLITFNGAAERINVRIPIADHPLLVFSMHGVAYFLDTSVAVDTPTEGPKIVMAIFVPSAPGYPILGERNKDLRPDWLRTIPKGSSTTFRSSGYVVSIVRSARTDVAVVAAAPESYVAAHVLRFALIFVPIGLLCAGLLTWAVRRISRIRFSIPSALRSAARRREFFLEYQPIVDLRSRRWVGAEALVRWRRSGGRIVRPENFVPIAEESGIITQITACVAEIVAADLPGLLRIDADFFIAMNLSAPDLLSPQTIDLFRSMMARAKAQPSNLAAEATERGFMSGAGTREIIDALRQMGIAVAIDDFGTGYSSLACLESLGLDELKIDKAFVENIGTDGATSQVVPLIIQMAHSLRLSITAEGVETEPQVEFLREREVHRAQGWLFSRPISVTALREALNAQRAQPPKPMADANCGATSQKG
jgi:c-di-GMP phosphodiesterase